MERKCTSGLPLGVHFIIMNIIELKKKYNKVFKIKFENVDIIYRSFNASEMILLSSGNNEIKYKEQITSEAVINKEDFDKLNWPSKELLYNTILKSSTFGEDQDDIIKKKLELKNQLDNNPYLILIKQILSVMPIIDINKLLECNAEQLLFYTVLTEELSGKNIIETNPLKTEVPAPNLNTLKKSQLSQQDLTENSMNNASNDLMNKLGKHGAEIKQFVKKHKKDQFEE